MCLHLVSPRFQDSAGAGEYDVDAEAYVEEEREPEVKPKILLMGPKRYAAHILMITGTATA